jgi:tetratricopeptide (TPR) repeat protein
MTGVARRRALLLALILVPVACARPHGGRPAPRTSKPAPVVRDLPSEAPPFHLTQIASEGGGARRASVKLVLDGLDADEGGDADAAARLYQRALQVDPANPYAYLALARSWVDRGDPTRALNFLDKAESLLGAQRARDPSVDAVVAGLRASALGASGRDGEAAPLFARARALAPDTWADGRLDASELR